MSQPSKVVQSLKEILRLRGITYRDLGVRIGLSEASVKRIFSEESFTLQRLDEVCEVLGVSFYQLAKMSEGRRDPDSDVLTPLQEEALARSPDLFTLFYLLLEGQTLKQIRREFTFTSKEEISLLRELDRLGLIELHGEHLRVKMTRLVKWNLDGPLMQLYRDRLREEFFASSFKEEKELVRLIPGKLTLASFTRLRQKIHKLLEEYDEMVDVDTEMEDGKAFDLALLVAYRPWRFSLIDKRRQKRKV